MAMKGWSKKLRGYRGQIYWVYEQQDYAMVRENVLRHHRRFEVYHWSQLDSQHETLAAAKKRVMQLLENEAENP